LITGSRDLGLDQKEMKDDTRIIDGRECWSMDERETNRSYGSTCENCDRWMEEKQRALGDTWMQ
jgi:hypothetical protein